MVSRLGVAAGVAGAIIVGYCVYFDNKRRSDPEYRKKIKLRREKKRTNTSHTTAWPDLKDTADIQRFFMMRMQEGEELIAGGDVEAGTFSIAQAITVCAAPEALMGVLQQSMPTDVFQLLLKKLPVASKALIESMSGEPGPAVPKGVVITEDVD